MGFLRRLFGGTEGQPTAGPVAPVAPVDVAALDEAEGARELELARFDQERAGDLVRRQQQYADRSWTPPAQGGDRRADDAESAQR